MIGQPIGLPEIVAGAIMSWRLPAMRSTGGADYGGGVWDLLASGSSARGTAPASRGIDRSDLEANHVWLIVAVVVLFTGFPAAFGVLGTVLHVPITILLIGIVLRGSAFVFRSYGRAEHRIAERWGLVFSIASVVTPLCFGIVIGAISSGAVGQASARAATGARSFTEVYVAPWLAVYPADGRVPRVGDVRDAGRRLPRARRARRRPPRGLSSSSAGRGDGRRSRCRGLAARVDVVGAAHRRAASPLHHGRSRCTPSPRSRHSPRSPRSGGDAIDWRGSRPAAQVTLILWGWALAQYPFVIPPTLTIRQSAAPDVTLELLLVGLAGGALILIPSLRLLFKTFSPMNKNAPMT